MTPTGLEMVPGLVLCTYRSKHPCSPTSRLWSCWPQAPIPLSAGNQQPRHGPSNPRFHDTRAPPNRTSLVIRPNSQTTQQSRFPTHSTLADFFLSRVAAVTHKSSHQLLTPDVAPWRLIASQCRAPPTYPAGVAGPSHPNALQSQTLCRCRRNGCTCTMNSSRKTHTKSHRLSRRYDH